MGPRLPASHAEGAPQTAGLGALVTAKLVRVPVEVALGPWVTHVPRGGSWGAGPFLEKGERRLEKKRKSGFPAVAANPCRGLSWSVVSALVVTWCDVCEMLRDRSCPLTGVDSASVAVSHDLTALRRSCPSSGPGGNGTRTTKAVFLPGGPVRSGERIDFTYQVFTSVCD